MDKGDIAIAIALLSASFTGWQSYSAHITARIARASQRRKRLVLEVDERSGGPDRWGECRLIIRNLEPVSAIVTSIYTTSKRAKLVDPAAIELDTSAYPPTTGKPSKDLARKSLPVRHVIGEFGSSQIYGRHGGIAHIRVLSLGPVKASEIGIRWEWADGQKI